MADIDGDAVSCGVSLSLGECLRLLDNNRSTCSS